LGDSAGPQDLIKRAFVQRSLATQQAAPAAASFDPLDPSSISARQRQARQMREGLNDSFGTSTRGTDLPQGGGLKGPDGDPIIAGPTVTSQPGTNAVDDAYAQQQRQQDAANAADIAGPKQKYGTPKTYRF
jgi:hypothetical protein